MCNLTYLRRGGREADVGPRPGKKRRPSLVVMDRRSPPLIDEEKERAREAVGPGLPGGLRWWTSGEGVTESERKSETSRAASGAFAAVLLLGWRAWTARAKRLDFLGEMERRSQTVSEEWLLSRQAGSCQLTVLAISWAPSPLAPASSKRFERLAPGDGRPSSWTRPPRHPTTTMTLWSW